MMHNIDFTNPRNFYPHDRYITRKNTSQRQESANSSLIIPFRTNLQTQVTCSSNSSYSSLMGDIFEGQTKNCVFKVK